MWMTLTLTGPDHGWPWMASAWMTLTSDDLENGWPLPQMTLDNLDIGCPLPETFMHMVPLIYTVAQQKYGSNCLLLTIQSHPHFLRILLSVDWPIKHDCSVFPLGFQYEGTWAILWPSKFFAGGREKNLGVRKWAPIILSCLLRFIT
jgi:hypothetical protein